MVSKNPENSLFFLQTTVVCPGSGPVPIIKSVNLTLTALQLIECSAKNRLKIYLSDFLVQDCCVMHALVRHGCHARLSESTDWESINLEFIVRATARRLATTRASHHRKPRWGPETRSRNFFDMPFVARSSCCCATDRQLLVAACNLIQYVAGRGRVFAKWVKYGDVPALQGATPHPRTELGRGGQRRDQTRPC